MTRAERKAAARQVLDRARDGGRVSAAEIRQALIDSGDLACEAVVQIRRGRGTWERCFAYMMAPATRLDPLH